MCRSTMYRPLVDDSVIWAARAVWRHHVMEGGFGHLHQCINDVRQKNTFARSVRSDNHNGQGFAIIVAIGVEGHLHMAFSR